MAFSGFQILQGIFGSAWVAIAVWVGIKIILKASELERKELITVGLTYIFISSAWWGVVFQFITYGLFSVQIPDLLYLFIGNVFVPLSLVTWLYSFSEIIIPFQKKYVLTFTIIYSAVWELVLIVLLFVDLELVGTVSSVNILDSSHGSVMSIFVLLGVIIFAVSGIYFSIKSMMLDDPEIKWKGRFLLIAWINFTLGALLDALIKVHTPLTLIITRLILISSAILYFLGFFLPEALKQRLIE